MAARGKGKKVIQFCRCTWVYFGTDFFLFYAKDEIEYRKFIGRSFVSVSNISDSFRSKTFVPYNNKLIATLSIVLLRKNIFIHAVI